MRDGFASTLYVYGAKHHANRLRGPGTNSLVIDPESLFFGKLDALPAEDLPETLGLDSSVRLRRPMSPTRGTEGVSGVVHIEPLNIIQKLRLREKLRTRTPHLSTFERIGPLWTPQNT